MTKSRFRLVAMSATAVAIASLTGMALAGITVTAKAGWYLPSITATAATTVIQGFMRPVASLLLFDAAVEDELALTAKQRKMRDSDTIYASLTAAQKLRLTQIVMNLQGSTVLGDPDMQSQLGLSEKQQKDLEEIQEATMQKFRDLRDPQTGEISEDNTKESEAVRKAGDDAKYAVLTQEQAAKLKTLLGKPFDRTKVRGISFAHSPGGKISDPGPNVPRPEQPKIAAGSLAPSFTAKTIDGKVVKLSDYKGKVIILDFWATWCGPCKQSMPGMQKLKNQVKDPKVVFLWLCVFDQQPKFKKFVKDNPQYKFKFLFDPAGGDPSDRNVGIPGKYSVTGLPATFVIDQAGKVVFRGEGTDGKGPDVRLVKSLKALGIKI